MFSIAKGREEAWRKSDRGDKQKETKGESLLMTIATCENRIGSTNTNVQNLHPGLSVDETLDHIKPVRKGWGRCLLLQKRLYLTFDIDFQFNWNI